MGSAGIGQPFKVVQQYINHVGDRVEVLTVTGEKLKGTLKDAGQESFTLTVTKKVKTEGAKRPKLSDEDLTMAYADICWARYVIDFK